MAPRMTPNLMADMLPVTMKDKKPPRERSSPAMYENDCKTELKHEDEMQIDQIQKDSKEAT